MPNRSTNPPKALWRTVTRLLLAANLVFGIAIIAILPPFEGADETAHFSRIQSQAFADQSAFVLSASGKKDHPAAHISAEVFDYYRRGPMPYQWISFDLLHKDDPLRGYMTYPDFFAAPAHVTEFERVYSRTPLPAGFTSSPETNPQYQHPGLYYLLMAQPMKLLAGHASLLPTLFMLRLVSFMLAFAGFVIGLLATRTRLRHAGSADADRIAALGAFYPFLMPQFFWEFARLGNDSLCLFFFGIAWALLLWQMAAPRGEAWIYLGFALGLGLMTKALMAPVAGAALVFLGLYHVFVVRASSERWWLPPVGCAILTFALGAPLYLIGYVKNKSIGSGHLRLALQTPDAWHVLQQHFMLHDFLHGLLGLAQTAVWLFGTWSLIIIDLPVHRVLLIFSAAIFATYIAAARRGTQPYFRVLPLWLIATFVASLTLNIFVALILQNNDATPGYYIHILAPAVALVYGVGLNHLMRQRWLKIFMAIFCMPVLLFNFFILWSYMAAFAGCAVPEREGGSYHLHPADIIRCADSFGTVTDRLGVLAWPEIALAAAGLAFILLAAASVLTLRAARAAETS